jgi:hypothetical protein
LNFRDLQNQVTTLMAGSLDSWGNSTDDFFCISVWYNKPRLLRAKIKSIKIKEDGQVVAEISPVEAIIFLEGERFVQPQEIPVFLIYTSQQDALSALKIAVTENLAEVQASALDKQTSETTKAVHDHNETVALATVMSETLLAKIQNLLND